MYKRLQKILGLKFELTRELHSFPENNDNEVLYSSFKFLSRYIKTVSDVIEEHKNGFIGEGYYNDY